MAQSTTQVGNLNITTQVLPATNTNESTVPNSVKNVVPMISKRFKKTPIKALSSVLILTGILQLSLGVVMFCAEKKQVSLTVRSGVSIWAGLVVFIAGCTSLIALLKDTVDLIKLCMVWNIFSMIVAATGLILYAIQIYFETQTCWMQEGETYPDPCSQGHEYYSYYYKSQLKRLRISVNAVIILFSLLGMGVSCFMTKASDKALKASGYSLLSNLH